MVGGDGQFIVSASATAGGSISPVTQTVSSGDTATFTLTADNGFAVGTVIGCNGKVSGSTYTTGAITADCSVTAAFKLSEPSTPRLSFAPVKRLRFEWTDNALATHYRLLENPDGHSGFTQVGDDIKPKVEKLDHQVPLYARVNAQYILQSCVNTICSDSAPVLVSGTLVNSIGYVKASDTSENNIGKGSEFGISVSLSRDGDTLAVGAL